MPDVSIWLNEAKEQTDLATGEVHTFGSLGGLKVGIYTGGISVIGSLAKFYYPSNIYILDRASTLKAIEKMSDELHLPMCDALVTGLEFGTQMMLKKNVDVYLSKLGDMPKLLRYHFEVGTLYYKHKGRQQPKVFALYDKIEDAKAKGLAIPAGFADANLLKYEMRLNGKLAKQLCVPEVKASTLVEREFYRMLVMKWQQHYFSISRMNQVKTDIMCEIKNVGDAYDVLVARLLSQVGQTQISDYMEELKSAKVFANRSDYTRLKRKIQDVATKAKISVCDEDLRELDDEIKNVAAYV